MDTEHLFVIPINWLNHCLVLDVNINILIISIMPTVRQNIFLLINISRVGIPKSTVFVIIFRVFMWPLSLINVGLRSIIHSQCIKIVSPKRRDHLLQAIWTMGFLCNYLILPQHPRERKIAVVRLSPK